MRSQVAAQASDRLRLVKVKPWRQRGHDHTWAHIAGCFRAVLFALSVAGIFLNRKNVLLLLMCIELLLLAANFNFVAFSRYLGQLDGQIFVFFVLTVAAAESAIGLAILVVLFRERRSINVEEPEHHCRGWSHQENITHESNPIAWLIPAGAADRGYTAGRIGRPANRARRRRPR